MQLGVDVRPGVGNEAEGDFYHVGDDNYGFTSVNATMDPSLFIHATNLTNIKEGQFFIVWTCYLQNTCTDVGQDCASDTINISFNISQSAAAPGLAVAIENCASQSSFIEVDQNFNTSIIDVDGERCPFDVISKNGTGGGDPCALNPPGQIIAANVSKAMCVVENGTRACESTAGLRLIQFGLTANSFLVLVATISVLYFFP